MNGIGVFNGTNYYKANKNFIDKATSKNIIINTMQKTCKLNISNKKLAKNQPITDKNDIEQDNSVGQDMFSYFTDINQQSILHGVYIEDNTVKIDEFVNKTKQYTQYINDNFSGDQKQ